MSADESGVATFCEPSWATVTSRVHIRIIGTEGRKPGGGITGPALCGFALAGGWDLAGEVTTQRIQQTLHAETGPTCTYCAAAYLGTAQNAATDAHDHPGATNSSEVAGSQAAHTDAHEAPDSLGVQDRAGLGEVGA